MLQKEKKRKEKKRKERERERERERTQVTVQSEEPPRDETQKLIVAERETLKEAVNGRLVDAIRSCWLVALLHNIERMGRLRCRGVSKGRDEKQKNERKTKEEPEKEGRAREAARPMTELVTWGLDKQIKKIRRANQLGWRRPKPIPIQRNGSEIVCCCCCCCCCFSTWFADQKQSLANAVHKIKCT